MSTKERHCRDCPSQISANSKGGRCRSCTMRNLNQQKAFTERRVAGIRKRYAADPAFAAEKTRLIVEAARKPEERQRRSERAKLMGLSRLGHAALKGNEQLHRRRGQAVSRTRMSHVPSGYLELYRDLIGKQKLLAAEALRIVIDQRAADLRRLFPGASR